MVPDTVTSIGNNAFMGCTSLTDLSFLSWSITSIGSSAFENCTGLTEAQLPAGVKTLGDNAFKGCSNLVTFVSDDALTSFGSNCFQNCTALQSVTLTDKLTVIPAYAFAGCRVLENLVIPKGVKEIKNNAFYQDTKLLDFTIPETVTSIGSNAFSYPAKTTVRGVAGSYAETYASWKEFIDITKHAAGIALATGGSSLSIPYRGTFTPTFLMTPTDATDAIVSMISSDTSIVAVRDGLSLYGQNKGTATVTVRASGGVEFSFTVSVTSGPSITTQPANVTVAAGAMATFKVTATGAETYQWQASTDGGKTWANSGANGNKTATLSFTAAAAHNGYMFRCVMTGGGETVTSNAAKLTVGSSGSSPTITAQPTSVSVATGATATFRVTATGAETYQWQASTDGGKTWANSGANGNKTATLSFTVAAAHNGYMFRCIVKGSSSVTSNAVKLTVTGGTTITAQPTNATVSAGATATFKVTATGATSYQWQASTDGGKTWANSGANGNKTATLSFTAATSNNGYMFRCIVKGSGGSVTSSAAKLTVTNPVPTITKQPENTTVMAGSTATFKVTATGATSYQWQASTDGGKTWANSGANGNKTATLSFTAAAAHNGYRFRCVVTGGGKSVTSNAAILTVGGASGGPTITSQPTNVTAAVGAAATFKVAATGATGYQWQASTDGGKTWANSGANGNQTATLNFTAAAAHNGYQFRCIVKNSGGQSTVTNAATLTVK